MSEHRCNAEIMVWSGLKGRIEDRSVCRHCHLVITLFGGLWWTPDDDFMCPDGQTHHAPAPPKKGPSDE